jgi:hypothetical protein
VRKNVDVEDTVLITFERTGIDERFFLFINRNEPDCFNNGYPDCGACTGSRYYVKACCESRTVFYDFC